jgi:hypothetical protein
MSLRGYRRPTPTSNNRLTAGLFSEIFKLYGSNPTNENLKKVIDVASIDHNEGNEAALPQIAALLSELKQQQNALTVPVNIANTMTVQKLLDLTPIVPMAPPIAFDTYNDLRNIKFEPKRRKFEPNRREYVSPQFVRSPLSLRTRDVPGKGLILDGRGTVTMRFTKCLLVKC